MTVCMLLPLARAPRRIPWKFHSEPLRGSVTFRWRAARLLRQPSSLASSRGAYKTRAGLPLIGSKSRTGLKTRAQMFSGTAADSQPKAPHQGCFPLQALLAGSYMLVDWMLPVLPVTTSPYPVWCVNQYITKAPPTTPAPPQLPLQA